MSFGRHRDGAHWRIQAAALPAGRPRPHSVKRALHFESKVETTMNIRVLLASAALAGLASGTLAQELPPPTCGELVTQVDGMIATQGNDLNEEVLAQIVALRNDGAQQCDDGDDDEAAESLEHAISLFSQ